MLWLTAACEGLDDDHAATAAGTWTQQHAGFVDCCFGRLGFFQARRHREQLAGACDIGRAVVQMVALSDYVKSDPLERGPAVSALRREFGLGRGRGRAGGGGRGAGGGRRAGAPATPACPVEGASPAAAERGDPGGAAAGVEALSPGRRVEFNRRLADIDRTWPAAGRATVKDFVDGIDYAVRAIGIDYVGISSDFDGGGGIDGWNSAAETFNVTLELVRRGYTEEQIGKIWSGNLLRVWREVERVAKDIQGGAGKLADCRGIRCSTWVSRCPRFHPRDLPGRDRPRHCAAGTSPGQPRSDAVRPDPASSPDNARRYR